MKDEKSLVKNSIYYTASTLICMVIPLAIYPYITRVLGPENYGKFSFALNLITYFTILSTLGVTNYSQRLCATISDKNELSKAAKEILIISASLTILSLICYAVVVVVLGVKGNEIWLYLFFGGMIIFSSLKMDWIIVARNKFSFASVRDVSARVLLLILAYVVIRDKSDYAKYALIYTISFSILPAVMNYGCIFSQRIISLKSSIGEKISVIPHIKPIFFLSLVTIGSKIFSGMDTMMLKFLQDDTAVGIYNNAVKLPLVMDELLMAIATVVTPKLYAAVNQGNKAETKSLINYASNTMFCFALPALLTFAFFSKELILLIGGKAYLSGSNILIVYSLIMFTTLSITLGGTRMFIALKKEKQLFLFLLMAGVLNGVLNWILIPHFSGLGAAAATIISNICLFIAEATYIKSWGLIFDKDKLKYLCAGAVLAAVFIVLKKILVLEPIYLMLVSILVGGVFYAAFLLILKESTAVRVQKSLVKLLRKIKILK